MLSTAGRDVLGLSFPGKQPDSIGRLVYDLHHDDMVKPDPLALQALHVAAHIDAIRGPIRKALELGRLVLLDRYWWSTWVYGTTAGITVEIMDSLIDVELMVWGELKPATVLLVQRDEPFRKEHTASYHRRLSQGYKTLAEGADHPVSIVDNNAELPRVVRSAFELVEAALERTDE